MGIGSRIIPLLADLRTRAYLPTPSAVVEIGAQQLGNSLLNARAEVEMLGQLFGATNNLSLPEALPTHIVHGDLEHLDPAAPPARAFYEWLGFTYACVDIDGSPDSMPLDLNYDSCPSNKQGRYQLVTNFGTTEHVANQLNAFKVIHELTAHGGVMVHELPAQGMFNHGLVNYNPKFFWMLARSNEYKFLHMDFRASETPYRLPQNTVDMIAEFAPDIVVRREKMLAVDSVIEVVLQKTLDIPFVAPIDVPTGATTDIEELRNRYWTVFKPGPKGLHRAGPLSWAKRGAAFIKRSCSIRGT